MEIKSVEIRPKERGYYPVVLCFDDEEGGFPCGAFWDGDEWSSAWIVEWVPVVFKTSEEAKKYAVDNEIGF